MGVVSVESDPDLSGASRQIVDHAIGGVENVVRHTALIPGDDIMLDETLETLRENYEFGEFDVVVIAGQEDRALQTQHVAELVRARSLRRPGGVVVALGPDQRDSETRRYVNS